MRILTALSLSVGMAVALVGPALAAEKAAAKTGTQTAAMEPTVGPRFKASKMPVSAARGERIFVELCAVCHGIKGLGDGPRAAFFPDIQYIPDLTDANFISGRDEEILDNIRQGLRRLDEPLIVMPQFKYILSDEEIQSVFAYVKSLSSKTAKKEPSSR